MTLVTRHALLALIAVLAGAVPATTARLIPILAKGLTFEPEVVSAVTGDVLEFDFLIYNHSVVMGGFDTPCQPATARGFFSGVLLTTDADNVAFPPHLLKSSVLHSRGG